LNWFFFFQKQNNLISQSTVSDLLCLDSYSELSSTSYLLFHTYDYIKGLWLWL